MNIAAILALTFAIAIGVALTAAYGLVFSH
jgi:hypothetical protein